MVLTKKLLIDHFTGNGGDESVDISNTRVIVFLSFRDSLMELVVSRALDLLQLDPRLTSPLDRFTDLELSQRGLSPDPSPSVCRTEQDQERGGHQPKGARPGTSLVSLARPPAEDGRLSPSCLCVCRVQILDDFKSGKYNVLVATQVAEEGLDIGAVDKIINYDVPSSSTRTVRPSSLRPTSACA